MSVNEIEEGIQELPEELKREVLDYVEFLLSKYESKNHGKKFKSDWEGGLSGTGENLTSVDLQHKALEWR